MKIVVTKRNGDLVSFEKNKIEKAILKAMIAYNFQDLTKFQLQ